MRFQRSNGSMESLSHAHYPLGSNKQLFHKQKGTQCKNNTIRSKGSVGQEDAENLTVCYWVKMAMKIKVCLNKKNIGL